MYSDSNPELPFGLTVVRETVGRRRVQCVALEDTNGLTLFDCGLTGFLDSVLKSPNPEKAFCSLILSHADVDHFGNASILKKLFPELRIFAHRADQRWLEDPDLLLEERYDHARRRFHCGYSETSLSEFRRLCGDGICIDGLLEQGDEIRIGPNAWKVLHVPGHSPGHIALWNATSGTLLLGDAVLGLGIPDIDNGVSMPPTHQFIVSYIETVKTLELLPVKLALTGHWPPLNEVEFKKLLADSRFCVERDLAFVRSELVEGPKNFGVLLTRLNERFRAWPSDQDEHYSYALAGYIDYLESLGEVVVLQGEIRTI